MRGTLWCFQKTFRKTTLYPFPPGVLFVTPVWPCPRSAWVCSMPPLTPFWEKRPKRVQVQRKAPEGDQGSVLGTRRTCLWVNERFIELQLRLRQTEGPTCVLGGGRSPCCPVKVTDVKPRSQA